MSNDRKTQALSLLEGILEETSSEAENERIRLELERQEREAQSARDAAEAEQRRRDEIVRRLAEEEDRQRAAIERRTATLEALRVEELKEKGLWHEPEPEARPQSVGRPTRPSQSTREVVAAQKRSRRGTYVAAAALFTLLAAGGAGVWYSMQIEYVDSRTPYAKSAPATISLAQAVATVGFEAIPEPVIVEAPPTEDADAGRRRNGRGNGSSSSSSSDPEPRRLQLGGNLDRD